MVDLLVSELVSGWGRMQAVKLVVRSAVKRDSSAVELSAALKGDE